VGTALIPVLAAAKARVTATATDADADVLREVGDAAVRGELRATIGSRYRLGQGPQACADFVGEHTTGKLVVTMTKAGTGPRRAAGADVDRVV
jgi:NADPH:quinone reductase-like Zn-dependent oxidoreductase